MIQKIVILILATTCFIGCADTKKKKPNTSSSESEQLKNNEVKENVTNFVKEVKVSPKDCGMNFDTFFVKFSRDSVFQRSRIKHPLKMIYFDAYGSDQTTPIEEYVKLQDYQFFDFSIDVKAKDRKVDRYTTKIEKNDDDTYKYYQLGIDNGIMVEFKFIRENGCWLLLSLKDEST